MTLRQLLDEFGITTYDSLIERCNRMGVAPPTEDEFLVVAPSPVNNPPEGVFVIEVEATEQQVVTDQSNQKDHIDMTVAIEEKLASVNEVQDLEASQKKQKKKKDDLQGKINE